ncbi:hypothetical protein ACIJYB_04005 [Candidatus Pelagibacter bacterium nBUS_44]|uniref:hypothetical protein n=1 Tax=Candidatus Pelagibacter bacterium nBUS_44 TaxID=3374195 RepID=UPI003EB8580F
MAIIKPNNNTISAITALPAAISTGKVLQVLQDTTSTQVDTTSTSFVAGGLSQAITPSSSSNKILIICSYTMSQINSGKNSICSIFRDSTNLDGGDLGLGRLRADTANLYSRQTISLLNSPSSTSAITYSLKLKCYSSSSDARLHQNSNIGSLTLMEIAG